MPFSCRRGLSQDTKTVSAERRENVSLIREKVCAQSQTRILTLTELILIKLPVPILYLFPLHSGFIHPLIDSTNFHRGLMRCWALCHAIGTLWQERHTAYFQRAQSLEQETIHEQPQGSVKSATGDDV